MAFLSLPQEIILQIIDEVHPADLGSFVLTNTVVHALAESAIQKHQALLQQYSTIRLGDCSIWDGEESHGYALLFLNQLLENPRLAYYPKDLHIADWEFTTDHESQTACVAGVISSWATELAALGAENPWLNDEDRRKAWRDALLEPSNYVHHIAVLLTMLPNLGRLTIVSMSWNDSEPIREMAWAVAAANDDPESAVYNTALSKLRLVMLDSWATEMGEDMTLYAPFATLPSMRSLHGRMVSGEAYEGQINQRDAFPLGLDPKSEVQKPWQIEEINVEYSAVDCGSWESVLKHIPNLKRFIYEHEGASVGYADYDCHGIVNALKTYASHSLVRLDLTASQDMVSTTTNLETGDCKEDILEQFVDTLRDFQKLRVLRMDDTAFQKPERGEIARLVDILPASVRVVRLLREINVGDPADLFVGLAEGKKDKLPELKKIALEGDYVLQRDLVDKCNEVGIEITGPCLKITSSS